MGNMIDYIKWRGDLLFENNEFNDIDNIILSRLSYLPLEDYNNHFIKDLNLKSNIKKEDLELIKNMAESERFKNIKILNYTSVINADINEQFAAVVLQLTKDLYYISFCGSNDSLISWHENFDMFYKKQISGQITATKYLEDAIKKFNGKFIVGGHSKGGNLAIYASSFLKSKLQKQIIIIYNNDGPGFSSDFIESAGYNNILNKIKTIVPQTTIVSTFFQRKEKPLIINSINKGVKQHDMYSWSVLGNNFIEDEKDNNSKTIEKIFNTWVEETTPEERREFVTILFEMMNATDSKVFKELGINSLKHVDDISKVYKKIDENKKKEMINILKLIFSISSSTIIGNIKKNFTRKEKDVGVN